MVIGVWGGQCMGMMGEGEGVVVPERRRAWRARATSWMTQMRV
jgi:hypothetical protein